jgi:hypothetical protein
MSSQRGVNRGKYSGEWKDPFRAHRLERKQFVHIGGFTFEFALPVS